FAGELRSRLLQSSASPEVLGPLPPPLRGRASLAAPAVLGFACGPRTAPAAASRASFARAERRGARGFLLRGALAPRGSCGPRLRLRSSDRSPCRFAGSLRSRLLRS